MNKRDLFFELCKVDVDSAHKEVVRAKAHMQEGYQRLQAEHDKTVQSLELDVEEAKINLKYADKKKAKDLLLAKIKVTRAEQALVEGREKARVAMELGYHDLKVSAEKAHNSLLKEKQFLVFAEEEKAKGFTET